MEKIEKNKLIAEFLGVFDKILSTGNIHSWSDAPFYYTTEDTREKVIKNISKYSKYSKDWNWLMKVIEKIESLENNLKNETREEFTQFQKVLSLPIYTKIEVVYNACVEFIKWYNQQNK